MKKYLRGRDAGEIPEMIEEELRQAGAPDDVVGHAGSEMEAARQALEWSRDGDLLLMLSHEARDEMLALMVPPGARGLAAGADRVPRDVGPTPHGSSPGRVYSRGNGLDQLPQGASANEPVVDLEGDRYRHLVTRQGKAGRKRHWDARRRGRAAAHGSSR